MAFGFSPKHIYSWNFEGLSNEQFLVLALEAVKKLNWNVSYVSKSGFIAYTRLSMTSWSEEVSVKLGNNHAVIKSECTGSQLFDWGKNKQNVDNLITTIKQTQDEYTTTQLEQKYQEIKNSIVSEANDLLNKGLPTTKEKISGFFSIFKPQDGYFITPILVNLNIAIFILMAITGVNIILPDNESLITWGANFRPVTMSGEAWRLITCCFLHIGVFHLLMNMYALVYIGLLLEPRLGRTRFMTAYILTGLASSVNSLWWNDFTISAGASGAIFGMYGVFLALLTTSLIEKTARKALLTSIIVFVGYNILNGLNANNAVDNAGHLGGLLSGIIIGYCFIPSLKRPEENRIKYSTVTLVSVLVFVSSFATYQQTPNDIVEYDNKMRDFALMETRALEPFSLPESTPQEKVVDAFRVRGIACWKENIKLLDSFEKMDLPLPLRTRNSLLREYCQLRIKSYELISRAISENSGQYRDELEECNQQISAKLSDLGGDSQN